MSEKSLSEIDWEGLIQDRAFHPSPARWEDQVLYFLMLDRFSDGHEDQYLNNDAIIVTDGTTPPFDPADEGNAVATPEDAERWKRAGVKFVGGTLKGLASKLGYLQRLGVTAVWISPVFKQVAHDHYSYHGYGIQNFIDVDPRFGTREDLRDLVRQAHELGLYVILDIIVNHTGDVFAYDADRYPVELPDGSTFMDPRWDGEKYDVLAFRNKHGQPTLPFGRIDLEAHPDAWPDGAVWPAELQEPDTFTREGYITNWDHDPEYRDADFFSLKDIELGDGDIDGFHPSPAMRHLLDVYRFWIAYADIDGYRLDTVKHMDPGATRLFDSVIHEFAERLGKENFYIIGEITGGRAKAFEILEQTGLDAALGINEIPDKLEYLVKGYRHAHEYFDLFTNSDLVGKGSNLWFKDKVVTMFDDHDQVRKGNNKARFAAGDPGNARLVLPVLGLNTTTMGIPCIYYGSEQAFDGEGDGDRYIRESMFGDEFGAFRTRNRHFFNESFWVYEELSQILGLRKSMIALRRGRQYLRLISPDGKQYNDPEMIGGEIRSIVPWSRIFDGQEVLLAINTDAANAREGFVQVDPILHPPGSTLTCRYALDKERVGEVLTVEDTEGGAAVWLKVASAGFVIYE
jgi:glycosidase